MLKTVNRIVSYNHVRRFSRTAANKLAEYNQVNFQNDDNKDVMMENHGHIRRDQYNAIRYDKTWQQRIIRREEKIFKQWKDMTILHQKQWSDYLMQRSDPGMQEQVPERFGKYVYFLREKNYNDGRHGKGNNNHQVYCRHEASLTDKQGQLTPQQQENAVEVVLDMSEVYFVSQNKLRDSFIDKIKMNDDHSLIAFTIDIGNTERCTAGVKDMKTQTILPGLKLEGVSQAEFFGQQEVDGIVEDVLIFVQMNELNRPYKVKSIGVQSRSEQTLFMDDDPTHYIDVSISKDHQCLFINTSTKEDSEVWTVKKNAENQEYTPKLLIPRRKDVRIHIEHIRDFFLIISNNDSHRKSFRLQTLKDEHYELPLQERQDKWENLLAPGNDDSLIISEFDCFENFIAVYVTQDNRPQIIIQDLDTLEFNTVNINDGDIGQLEPMLNNEYQQDHLRFAFSNPFIYHQQFRYDHLTKNTRKIQDIKLRGSPQIIRNNFECKEFLVPGHDGEQIPMNIYYKKGDVQLNRKNRVLMEGYGAYGINLTQGFNIAKTCAMERGWVIAEAFVRGGGEKGIQWHDQGKMHNKSNSMLDFISCAEYLVSKKITHPNLLAAKGQSAGGTLVAQACMNMRPDLFRACILNQPFLDVLNNLLDDSLALSATDYLEFGNPIEDEKIFQLINSYCPYQNLSNNEYPACLIQSSVVDTRVPIWGTLKFIEKLREISQTPSQFPNFASNNIVCRISQDEGQGHFGSVDNDQNIASLAFEFAWLDYLMFAKRQ